MGRWASPGRRSSSRAGAPLPLDLLRNSLFLLLSLFAVVPDGLDRAGVHGFLALRLLLGSRRLLVDVRVALLFLAREVVRGRDAAHVAVDALGVHVELSGGVVRVAVVLVRHRRAREHARARGDPLP